MDKSKRYVHRISPGVSPCCMCRELGIGEMSFHGFTADNTRQPSVQRQTFTRTCMVMVEGLVEEGVNLLMLGNTKSPMFPQELLPFTVRCDLGKGGIRINFLVNYSWGWDLGYKDGAVGPGFKTSGVSRIDLIIRWGEGRRLSGFLPVQSVYSDFYVVDGYWPDFRREHVEDALKWHTAQDITLGG